MWCHACVAKPYQEGWRNEGIKRREYEGPRLRDKRDFALESRIGLIKGFCSFPFTS